MPDISRPLYRIKITKPDNTTYDITNLIDIATTDRMATEGLGYFNIKMNVHEPGYVDFFSESDIVEFFATYESEIVESRDLLFRGEIDNTFLDFSAGIAMIEITGRDYPDFADDETVIRQYANANIIDAFIDRTSPTGTADSRGNFETGLLYNTGLKLEFFDHISANDWVKPTDLSDGDFTTLKDNFPTTITKSYINKNHISIAQDLAEKAGYDWYIHYNPTDGITYLRLFTSGQIMNNKEFIVLGMNWIAGPSRWGRDRTAEINDVVVYGKSVGNLLHIRTARDNSLISSTRRKSKSFTESSINSITEMQERADLLLSTNKTAPLRSDGITAIGLLTLKPGDMIRLSNNLLKINGRFKVSQFQHSFSGAGLDTTVSINKIEDTISVIQKELFDIEEFLSFFNNPNDMQDALFFQFSPDEASFYSLTNTVINQRILTLASGQSSGTFQTQNTATFTQADFPDNIAQAELRVEGVYIDACVFEISNQNGLAGSFQTLELDTETPLTFSTIGKEIVLKVTLNTSSTGNEPQIGRMCVLLKRESS